MLWKADEKDNAITRECVAELLCADAAAVKTCTQTVQKGLREEYTNSDEGITIEVAVWRSKGKSSSSYKQIQNSFLSDGDPVGIQKMSGSIEGLVETSTNIGIMKLDEEGFVASSV